jgi:hypothetical protein
MIDPISVFTGIGIEAAAAKNSVTMRALALSIAKANTRAGKIKAGIKLGAIYGTAEALGGLTLLNAEPTAPKTPPAIVPNAMFTTLSSTE